LSCRSAEPLVPIGKNNSGFSPRQAAYSYQLIVHHRLSCPIGTKELHPSSMILSGGYQLTETCHLDTWGIIGHRFGGLQPFDRGTHLVEQVADRCCAGEGIVREHD
jgi:hypothetical protein